MKFKSYQSYIWEAGWLFSGLFKIFSLIYDTKSLANKSDVVRSNNPVTINMKLVNWKPFKFDSKIRKKYQKLLLYFLPMRFLSWQCVFCQNQFSSKWSIMFLGKGECTRNWMQVYIHFEVKFRENYFNHFSSCSFLYSWK